MALTTEQLVLQAAILSDKTDSNTNPNMVFKSTTTLNKALDPSYFTGNNTKIVNAINLLAKQNKSVELIVTNMIDKTNSVLLDTSDTTNQMIWSTTQSLMGKNTIIEGIKNILEGNRQSQILGLKQEDIGKVLSVGTNESGELVAKAIDLVVSGGPVAASDVSYTNESKPELTTVSDVLDYLLINNTPSSIDWSIIENKPVIPNKLELTNEALIMREDDQEISKVLLTDTEDINNIIGSLS